MYNRNILNKKFYSHLISSKLFFKLIIYLSKVLFHLQSHILEPQDDDYYNDVPLFEINFNVSEYNVTEYNTENINGIGSGSITIKISTTYAKENEENKENFNVNILFGTIKRRSERVFLQIQLIKIINK